MNRYLMVCILALGIQARASAQGLTAEEASLRDAVDRTSQEAIAFIVRTAEINSGTFHPAGVRAVGAVYEEAFESLGMTTAWVTYPDSIGRGGHLVARTRGVLGPRVLLIGHLDTVFEPSSPFQGVVQQEDRLIGPGVVDMKGGNAVIVFALRALHEAGVLHDRAITVFLTGDEEQPGALPLTRMELIEEAQKSDLALGFEGASGPASATVARRGVSSWRLEVDARTGHSSRIFSEESGYGAVYEAARILDAFRRALAGEPGLTLNPGVLAAGAEAGVDAENAEGQASGKSNIIAAHAVATGDLRFLTQDQLEMARSTMRNIARQNLPGTGATLTFEDRYPAMPLSEGNERLLRVFQSVSSDLGTGSIQADNPQSRGAADVSFVAPYVPAMDGLGPRGAGAHAEGESLSIPSVRIATARAALLIHRLTSPTN